MQANIAKTAFLTSLISYGVFLMFEYLRPGFVQYVFSVHWFLLVAVACGIWWAKVGGDCVCRRRIWLLVEIIAGLLLFVVLWREGGVFGDFRVLMAIAGLALPFVVVRLLRSPSFSRRG